MKQAFESGKDLNTVVPYIGTWIETGHYCVDCDCCHVVPYIGTWIETLSDAYREGFQAVVPYIGTWIETLSIPGIWGSWMSYLI